MAECPKKQWQTPAGALEAMIVFNKGLSKQGDTLLRGMYWHAGHIHLTTHRGSRRLMALAVSDRLRMLLASRALDGQANLTSRG